MSRIISNADLAELTQRLATSYKHEVTAQSDRVHEARAVLGRMGDVMSAAASALKDAGVPVAMGGARNASEVSFRLSNVTGAERAGNITASVAPTGHIRVSVERRRVDEPNGITPGSERPRDPSEFADEAWRAEFADAMTWIFG